jgi:hypothetical protein
MQFLHNSSFEGAAAIGMTERVSLLAGYMYG